MVKAKGWSLVMTYGGRWLRQVVRSGRTSGRERLRQMVKSG